jgi:hypothetical protein
MVSETDRTQATGIAEHTAPYEPLKNNGVGRSTGGPARHVECSSSTGPGDGGGGGGGGGGHSSIG